MYVAYLNPTSKIENYFLFFKNGEELKRKWLKAKKKDSPM